MANQRAILFAITLMRTFRYEKVTPQLTELAYKELGHIKQFQDLFIEYGPWRVLKHDFVKILESKKLII